MILAWICWSAVHTDGWAQSSWTNGVTGNWNASKWDYGVPTSSSDVFITNQGGGGNYTVTLTNYAEINSLLLSAPATATNTFKLSNTANQLGSLYLSHGMTVGSGSIFDTGGRVVTGQVTIAAGGRMASSTVVGATPATITGVVTNQGTINLISGSGGNRTWGGLVNDGVLTFRFGFQNTQVDFNNPNSLFLNAGGTVLVSNENQATRLGLGYSGGPVLTNFGTITLYGNSTNTTSGSSRITVGGELTGNNGGSNLLLNASGGHIVLISQGGTNAGFSSYTTAADLAAFLRNEGTLTVDGTNASRILGGTVSGTSTNAGVILVKSGSTLFFYNYNNGVLHDLINVSNGLISIQGGTLALPQITSGKGTFVNEGILTNLGVVSTLTTFTNRSGGAIFSAGTFTTSVVNQGTITFLGGTSAVAAGSLFNSGSMDLQNGAVLNLAAPLTSQGSLIGSGKIAVNLATNAGVLAPGHSPGTLTFSSNLVLEAASVVNIELGGTNALDYDHLVANGTLTLGGTLNVTLINGYAPAAGDTVDILDWGAILGTFSTVNLPSAEWSAANLYVNGTLLYAIPEPGIGLALVVGLGVMAWRRRRSKG